jgi:sugar transferase (PEP-CTERM system associated)
MIRLFRVFIPLSTLILLISEILLISASFVLWTYIGLAGDPAAYLLDGGGLFSIGLVVLTIIIGLYMNDLYTDIPVKSVVFLIQQLCMIIGAAFVVQAAASYLNRNLRMPLHVMGPGSLFTVISIFSWRFVFSRYVLRVVGRDRILLVGNSAVLRDIAGHIAGHPEIGLETIGVVGDSHSQEPDFGGTKYLGPFDALRGIVSATRPSRIVVGMSERRNQMPVGELLALRFGGNTIEEAPSTYEKLCGRVSVKELRPSQIIYSGELGHSHYADVYQPLLNLAIAAAGLVVTLPLMAITALAVRFSSPGPVFYSQTRVGMKGAPFTLYKFRSMRVNAEAATGAVWAAKDDPRVTTVGGIIRKLRFDELPQLFNVLRGEMSIVGPRPERPEFVRTLSETIPYYPHRHSIRPGITGWAQINHTYGDTLEDTTIKLEYDLYYIKNMSLSLDIYIVFHTLKTMLLSRGSR